MSLPFESSKVLENPRSMLKNQSLLSRRFSKRAPFAGSDITLGRSIGPVSLAVMNQSNQGALLVKRIRPRELGVFAYRSVMIGLSAESERVSSPRRSWKLSYSKRCSTHENSSLHDYWSYARFNSAPKIREDSPLVRRNSRTLAVLARSSGSTTKVLSSQV